MNTKIFILFSFIFLLVSVENVNCKDPCKEGGTPCFKTTNCCHGSCHINSPPSVYPAQGRCPEKPHENA
ncbi:hypothetical protein ACQ4LE_005058 [Meloidogyne hapla]